MGMKKIYDEICEQAVDSLLKRVGGARMQSVGQIEGDPAVILKLLNISLEQRESLIKCARRFVTIDIDMAALDQQLNQLCQYGNNDDQENEFLLLEAPLAMMRELFGMHASEFSMRRRALGLGGENRGRPRIDEQGEAVIWDVWHELKDLDIRERYLKTAGRTGKRLLAVWTAVKRYKLYGLGAPVLREVSCRSVA